MTNVLRLLLVQVIILRLRMSQCQDIAFLKKKILLWISLWFQATSLAYLEWSGFDLMRLQRMKIFSQHGGFTCSSFRASSCDSDV